MIDTDALSGARDLARRERPLEGLRVLEFGSLIAGPFATRIMAEFGAEVIKVERPEVDDQLRDPFEGRPARGQVLHVVSRVVEAGIDDVAFSDTIGVAKPRQVFDIFEAVRKACGRS